MTAIRVTDYNGDFGTLATVYLIGPFPSSHAADKEAERLDSIADPGGYEFSVTDLEGEMASPAIFAQADDADTFEDAFGKAFLYRG